MTRSARRSPAPPPRKKTPWWSWHGVAGISPAEDRFWTVCAGVLLLALLVGLVAMAVGPQRVGDYFTETDFYGAYAEGARLIQHGHLSPGRYSVVGPIYEIVLALAGFVIPDLFRAAQIVSILSAATIVVLWFLMLRRRLDARYGALAVLFIVSNNFFFRFGLAVTTDALANALQAATLFALLAVPSGAGASSPAESQPGAKPGGADRAETVRFLVAGLLACTAFLTRYNAVALVPAGLIAIGFGACAASSRLRAALLFVGGFLVPVVPWIAWSLTHGGHMSLQLHHNIAFDVFARTRGIPWDTYQKTMQSEFPTLFSVIARDPAAVIGRFAANIVTHLRDDAAKLLGWPVAISAAIGLLFSFKDGSFRRLAPLLVAAALLFVTLVPVFHSERYSLALLPFYATFAAAAFASPLLGLAVGRSRRVQLKPVIALALVAALMPSFVRKHAYHVGQLPFEALEAGKILEKLRVPGDKLIARKPHVAYYAGVAPVAFPFADSLEQLARIAHGSGIRWLFMSWPEAETRPGFFYLIDTAGVVPGLTPRYSAPHRPAVLYEIGPEFGQRPGWFADDTLFLWHTLRASTMIQPGNAELQGRLGWLSWRIGRLAEAKQALLIATTLQPERAENFITLGRVHLALREREDAWRSFERARALQPSNPEARLGYGMAALLLGRDREAAEAWRDVIGAAADPRVLQAMAQLYDSMGDAAAAQQARQRLALMSTK